MDSMDAVQRSLLARIEIYVRRQTVVLAAMRELRPDIVARSRGELDGQQVAALTRRYYRSPQVGKWGEQQWNYFVHGGGCRLNHVVTGEPIEWDAGDLRRFDRYWFLHHLVWSFEHDKDQDTAALQQAVEVSGQSVQDFIFTRLEELRQAGALSEPDTQYRYTLLTIDEPM